MRRQIGIFSIILLPLLFVSCASFRSGYYEKMGLDTADRLNRGMGDALAADSRHPFVFEGEILASESQVARLWRGLTGAGYNVGAPAVEMNRPVRPEDARLFSESWEIRSFFEKYIREEDRILLIRGEERGFYLLMRKIDKRTYKLLGWKEASL